MCGVAGIINLSPGKPPQRSALERMIGSLRHRGPDGNGFFVDQTAGLAHARLSIIDLEGGGQPIHNEDESVWVVFNGEIFNYLELRRELKRRGHRFYTDSDTEVIVHLYEEYGDRLVGMLNGQFAIALWDKNRRKLLLARDRVGIRPLFYTRQGGQLLFASEVKALLANPDVPRRINVAALGDVFTYWAPLPPGTVFEGVESLPPGHCAVFENGRERIWRYWDWPFTAAGQEPPLSLAQAAEAVRELLVDSVRFQLRADVPVGAYLSGGLDSSVVTTIIRNFTDTPLRTFSLTFEDDEFDESRYQHELVSYLGTHHTSVRCTRAEICAAFPRAIWHAEAPILRTAPAPLMLLAGHVREQGYKVVLTGEGADEVFAGYDIYKEAKVRRFWAQQPRSRLRPRALERLYPYLKHSPVAGRGFTERFFAEGLEHKDEPWFAHIPRWTTTRRIQQFLSKDVQSQLATRDPYAEIGRLLPEGMDMWAPLHRDQYVEAHTLLSGYLLCSQGDRMAMANSIEGRFPFLDHRLIEFACRLPPRYKLRALIEKYVLKQSMKDHLPANIVRRPKQPYRAPDSASFFEGGRAAGYVEALFESGHVRDTGLFDPVATGKLFEKCRAGRAIGFADNMAFVGILSTLLVDQQFIRAAPVRPAVSTPPVALHG